METMNTRKANGMVRKAKHVFVGVLIPQDVVYLEINKAQALRFLADYSSDGTTEIRCTEHKGNVFLGN